MELKYFVWFSLAPHYSGGAYAARAVGENLDGDFWLEKVVPHCVVFAVGHPDRVERGFFCSMEIFSTAAVSRWKNWWR